MDVFLPGSASLEDLVDQHVLIMLRDGKRYFGTLRSYDQYGNLVVQDATETHFYQDSKTFAEERHGLLLIRGENIVLMGNADKDIYQEQISKLTKISIAESRVLQVKLGLEEDATREIKRRVMHLRGFCTESVDTDRY